MTLAGNKARGAKWETTLAEYLGWVTGHNVRRLRLTGRDDIGDLHLGRVVIEAKNCRTMELAAWCAEAAKEAANAGLPHWAVVIRRRGQVDPGQAYVVMSLDEWLAQTGGVS